MGHAVSSPVLLMVSSARMTPGEMGMKVVVLGRGKKAVVSPVVHDSEESSTSVQNGSKARSATPIMNRRVLRSTHSMPPA